MRSLLVIKETIEKELSLYPKKLANSFGDDIYVRLISEEELLKRLLAVTEDLIKEQAKLEKHLELHV